MLLPLSDVSILLLGSDLGTVFQHTLMLLDTFFDIFFCKKIHSFIHSFIYSFINSVVLRQRLVISDLCTLKIPLDFE